MPEILHKNRKKTRNFKNLEELQKTEIKAPKFRSRGTNPRFKESRDSGVKIPMFRKIVNPARDEIL